MEQARKNSKISEEIKSCIVQADRRRLRDIAKMYNINIKSVWYLHNSYKKFGVVSRAKGHRPKLLSDVHINRIRELMDEDCQRTLSALFDALEDELGTRASTKTIASERALLCDPFMTV